MKYVAGDEQDLREWVSLDRNWENGLLNARSEPQVRRSKLKLSASSEFRAVHGRNSRNTLKTYGKKGKRGAAIK